MIEPRVTILEKFCANQNNITNLQQNAFKLLSTEIDNIKKEMEDIRRDIHSLRTSLLEADLTIFERKL